MLLMLPSVDEAARQRQQHSRLQQRSSGAHADDDAREDKEHNGAAATVASQHRHNAAVMNGVDAHAAHAAIAAPLAPPPGMRGLGLQRDQQQQPMQMQRDSPPPPRVNSSPNISSSSSKDRGLLQQQSQQLNRTSLHPSSSSPQHSASTSNLHSSPHHHHNGVSQLSLARSGSGSLTCVFPTPQQPGSASSASSSSSEQHSSGIPRGVSASPSSASHTAGGELTPQHHHRALAGLSNIALPSPSPVSASGSGSSSARSVSRGALPSASSALQMQQLASASALSPPARSYPQSWSLTPPQQQLQNGAPISAAQHAQAIAQAQAQAHAYKQQHHAAASNQLSQPHQVTQHPLSAPSVTRHIDSRRPPASAHEAAFSSPMSAAAPYHQSPSHVHQHQQQPRYNREPVSPSMLQLVRPPSLRGISGSSSSLDVPAAATRPRSASTAAFLPVCACPCSCQSTHILHGYEGMACACGAPPSAAAAVAGSAAVAAASYSATARPSSSDLTRATRALEAGHIFLMHSLPAASSNASVSGGPVLPEVKKIVLFLFKGCLYACNYTPHVTRYSQPFMRVEILPGSAAAAMASATTAATSSSGGPMPPVWATMGPKGPVPVANYNPSAPAAVASVPPPPFPASSAARPLRLYPAKQTGALALSKLSPSRRCCTLVAPNPAWDLAQLKEREHSRSYASSASAATSATSNEDGRIASLHAGSMQVSLQPFSSSGSGSSNSLALPSMVFPSFTTGASHSFATPVAVHQSSGLQARTPRAGVDAAGAPSPKTPLSPCTPGGGVLATTPGGGVRRKVAGAQDRCWESPVHVLELEASTSSHLHSFVSALNVYCAGHARTLMLLCPPLHTETHVQAVAGRLFHGALSNRDARRRAERRERKSSSGAEDRLRAERAREKAAYTAQLESLRHAFEGVDSRVGLRLLAAMYDQGRGVREGKRRHEALRRINEERRKIEQEKTRIECAMAAAELSPQSSTRSTSSINSAPVHAASSPPSRTGPSFSSAGPIPPPHLFVAAPSDALHESTTASMLSSPMQLHHADTSLATQLLPFSSELKSSSSSGGGASKFFSNLFSRGQSNPQSNQQSPAQHQQQSHSNAAPHDGPASAPHSHHPHHQHSQHQSHHAAAPSSHPQASPLPSSASVVVYHHTRVPSGGSGVGQDSPDLEFGSRMAAAAASASRHHSSSHQAPSSANAAAKSESSPPLHSGASRGSNASWMVSEHDAPQVPASQSHLSLSLSDGSSEHPSQHGHASHSTMPVPSPPPRAQAAAKSSAMLMSPHSAAFGPASHHQQHPQQPHSGTDLAASSLLASSPSPRASSLSLDSVVPSPQTAPSGGFLSPEFLSPDSTRVWSYGN